MKEFMKTKAGVVLVGFSVLAVWMLLAARPVQAHTNVTPTCSNLPTAEGFFADANTALIVPDGLDHTPTAKQGEGTADKEGNPSFQYAKITVPQLTAGELRVFDNRAGGTNASAAVLCHEGSEHARYITGHPTSHAAAERAYTAAKSDQATAEAAGSTEASNTITERPSQDGCCATPPVIYATPPPPCANAATALTNADLRPRCKRPHQPANDAYDPPTTTTTTTTP